MANAVVAELETLGLTVAEDSPTHDAAVVLEPGGEFADTRSETERAEPALAGLPVHLTIGPVEDSFLDDKQDLPGARPQSRGAALV